MMSNLSLDNRNGSMGVLLRSLGLEVYMFKLTYNETENQKKGSINQMQRTQLSILL